MRRTDRIRVDASTGGQAAEYVRADIVERLDVAWSSLLTAYKRMASSTPGTRSFKKAEELFAKADDALEEARASALLSETSNAKEGE